MTSIVKASLEDIPILVEIGKLTFNVSHGSSASESDINNYLAKTYAVDVFKAELSDPKNIYHIIFHNNMAAGYSKIILNATHSNIQLENATKLQRLYILKEFYDLKLGYQLYNFNIEYSKKHNQLGMWLFVWIENARALNFYNKAGFNVIGKHNFKISETHSNPNHQMLLTY